MFHFKLIPLKTPNTSTKNNFFKHILKTPAPNKIFIHKKNMGRRQRRPVFFLKHSNHLFCWFVHVGARRALKCLLKVFQVS